MMWLQVINFYMALMVEVSENVSFFNSYFMERLRITDRRYCYANVERWSMVKQGRQHDVHTMEFVLIPVHESYHWFLILVCMQKNEIWSFD